MENMVLWAAAAGTALAYVGLAVGIVQALRKKILFISGLESFGGVAAVIGSIITVIKLAALDTTHHYDSVLMGLTITGVLTMCYVASRTPPLPLDPSDAAFLRSHDDSHAGSE